MDANYLKLLEMYWMSCLKFTSFIVCINNSIEDVKVVWENLVNVEQVIKILNNKYNGLFCVRYY